MVAIDQTPGESSTSNKQEKQTKKTLRYTSTADVRTLLSDLSMRPLSQREFLCKLLKRAAARAATTDSAVLPAESHHTTTS